MDTQVMTIDPKTGQVIWGCTSKTLSGLSKLVQVVVLSLLNVPGQDVLDPDGGGGLPALIGTNIDPENTTEITAEVVRRVRKTQQEILARQIGLDLPTEERLRDIQILQVERGETLDEILVRLRVINMAGRQQEVVL